MFSLEMSAEQIAQRMLAAESEVNLRGMFESHKVQNEQWQNCQRLRRNFQKAPFN
jgi:replicative DNA helicase